MRWTQQLLRITARLCVIAGALSLAACCHTPVQADPVVDTGCVAFSAILPVIPGFVAASLFVALIRFRRLRMGRCIVDRGAGLLRRLRGDREIERWPLSEVRFGLHWDPFHRGFTLQYWLTARVPDGRALRLGKGPRPEVERALLRMVSRRGG